MVTENPFFRPFRKTERKERFVDRHGGVILYVKDLFLFLILFFIFIYFFLKWR